MIKTKKQLVTVTTTIERFGEIYEISADGYVYYHVDASYGENADGHMGIAKTFVQDVKEIGAYTIEGDEVDLTYDELEQVANYIAMSFLEGEK